MTLFSSRCLQVGSATAPHTSRRRRYVVGCECDAFVGIYLDSFAACYVDPDSENRQGDTHACTRARAQCTRIHQARIQTFGTMDQYKVVSGWRRSLASGTSGRRRRSACGSLSGSGTGSATVRERGAHSTPCLTPGAGDTHKCRSGPCWQRCARGGGAPGPGPLDRPGDMLPACTGHEGGREGKVLDGRGCLSKTQ